MCLSVCVWETRQQPHSDKLLRLTQHTSSCLHTVMCFTASYSLVKQRLNLICMKTHDRRDVTISEQTNSHASVRLDTHKLCLASRACDWADTYAQ